MGYLATRARRNVKAKGQAWWQNTLNQEYGGLAEAAYLPSFRTRAPSLL